MGSWSLIHAPSLLALIPLVIMVVLAMRGYSNLSALAVGIIVGALIMGQNITMMAVAFQKSLATSTVMIGVIIMLGAGLGALMTEARITHTLVYWIVKRIGVSTQTRGKIALMVCSLVVCGLLGTMGGGNAVITPILIPIMASLGVTPSVVAVLLKQCGEIGLTLGPLTGVTLITMEVTGLSYSQLMLGAALPFAVFFLGGTWFAVKRTQRRTEGKEAYEVDPTMKDINSIVISPKDRRSAIVFLAFFIGFIVYGIISKQGTNYALMVMLLLCVVVGVVTRMKIDDVVKAICKGLATQSHTFLMFISIEVLLGLVNAGGGFTSLSNLLGSLAGKNPTAVMLIASVVGGFGIEAAAVAEIKIIAEMFGASALAAGLPMSMFAISILAATRLTGSLYPTTNFATALGVARCTNTKEALQACWIGVASACVFIVVWSFLGVFILT